MEHPADMVRHWNYMNISLSSTLNLCVKFDQNHLVSLCDFNPNLKIMFLHMEPAHLLRCALGTYLNISLSSTVNTLSKFEQNHLVNNVISIKNIK